MEFFVYAFVLVDLFLLINEVSLCLGELGISYPLVVAIGITMFLAIVVYPLVVAIGITMFLAIVVFSIHRYYSKEEY